MDTLLVESGLPGLVLETHSMPPVLVANYGDDTVRDASVRYMQPVLVAKYSDDTVYTVEGHGKKLIPPIRSASYAKDKDDEHDGDDHVVPLPHPHVEPASPSAASTIVASTHAGVTTHPAIIGEIAVPPPVANEPFDQASAIACVYEYMAAPRAKKPSSRRAFEAFKMLYDLAGKSVSRVAKRVNYPSSNCLTVLKQFEHLVYLVPEGWKLYVLTEQAGDKLSLGWLQNTARLTPVMQLSEIRSKARKHNIKI